MFDFTKSSYFTSLRNLPRKQYGKRVWVTMEVRGTLACFILLSTVPTFVISTSSIRCNATQICSVENARNTSGTGNNFTDCCRNISATSDTNLLQVNSSATTVRPTTALYIFGNSNGSQTCMNDSACSDEKCLSVKCVTTSSITTRHECFCDKCGDGRCFNMTAFRGATALPPTTKAPEEGITPLQLVLLFGSMGGIVVFICIVYCVKTFTDNRQRQYLLKHGVWDPPREGERKGSSEEVEENEMKSHGSRQESKMEVPTIRVEMENEISKSKESEIETVKEEENEDLHESTVEVLKPKLVSKVQHDIIKVRGYEPIPAAPNESSYHQNANPNLSTKEPNTEKTNSQGTIGSPTENNTPASWNKDLSKTPLTESPMRNRGFPTLKINKGPPKRIIANGTPEKSPKFNNRKRTASPPQLVEPENFSDFGM